MTFYAAVGSYKLQTEDGRHMPYILRMGRLEPISIPEFFIWSRLMWEVETYDALSGYYHDQAAKLRVDLPDFDMALNMLLKRKLVLRGVGYTGEDALYDMLSEAFISPVRVFGGQKLHSVMRMLAKGKITCREALKAMKRDKLSGSEQRIMNLVRQTPLSVSELIRCFDNGVTDVSTPDKVISGIYTDESDTQARILTASRQSEYRTTVLEAAANLYLGRKVILDF